LVFDHYIISSKTKDENASHMAVILTELHRNCINLRTQGPTCSCSVLIILIILITIRCTSD